MVIVRVLPPPIAISGVAKALVIIGAATALTVRDAVAALPVSAIGPVAVGANVVLVMGPAVVEVTLLTT